MVNVLASSSACRLPYCSFILFFFIALRIVITATKTKIITTFLKLISKENNLS